MVPLHDDLFDFFYEALPGYEKVGERRILLGCWGSSTIPSLRLHLQEHVAIGDARCSSRLEWLLTASWSPMTSSTSTWTCASCWAAPTMTTGRTRRPSCERSARQSRGSAAPVESDDDSASAETRLQRQLHLGYVAALVRQAHRRPSGARYRRRSNRPSLVDGAFRTCGHRIYQGDRQQRQDQPAEDCDDAGS